MRVDDYCPQAYNIPQSDILETICLLFGLIISTRFKIIGYASISFRRYTIYDAFYDTNSEPSYDPGVSPSSITSSTPSTISSSTPGGIPRPNPTTGPSASLSMRPSVVPTAQSSDDPRTSPSHMPSYASSAIPSSLAGDSSNLIHHQVQHLHLQLSRILSLFQWC